MLKFYDTARGEQSTGGPQRGSSPLGHQTNAESVMMQGPNGIPKRESGDVGHRALRLIERLCTSNVRQRERNGLLHRSLLFSHSQRSIVRAPSLLDRRGSCFGERIDRASDTSYTLHARELGTVERGIARSESRAEYHLRNRGRYLPAIVRLPGTVELYKHHVLRFVSGEKSNEGSSVVAQHISPTLDRAARRAALAAKEVCRQVSSSCRAAFDNAEKHLLNVPRDSGTDDAAYHARLGAIDEVAVG